MDFASLLSQVKTFKRMRPTEATDEGVLEKANAMARRGYIHNEVSLRALKAYLEGYGVLLSGGMGIGKTLFFQKVNPDPIPILSFSRCFMWKYDELKEWLDEHRNAEVVLDDIGISTNRGNNYGVQFDCLQVVLDHRLVESSARTHATTNCTNDELIERFDARSVDRLYQLCQCFAMPNTESKREAQVNWNYIRNRENAAKYGSMEKFL